MEALIFEILKSSCGSISIDYDPLNNNKILTLIFKGKYTRISYNPASVNFEQEVLKPIYETMTHE